MSSENQHNTKKAVAFLKTLFPGKLVNIVAIDPKSENVFAITRPVDSDAVVNFIDKNNGKRNLYYSVNTPTDNAPDNKLKKHHIKEINAVWLDADPVKDKDFKEERDRLHKFAKELASSENPPTVITDSGGGIQAFWMLEKPVPVNDDTRREYEALSRGLADQYGTDKVQNIDRIMRVPYTFNLPTKKKANREVTLARSSKISISRYKNFSFIIPLEATDINDDYSDIELDMEAIKKPIQDDLAAKLKLALDRNNRLHEIYFGFVDKPSRSEQDFVLAAQLKDEGFALEETANILWNFPHGKNEDLTKREIIRCYMRSGDNSINSDFVDSLSQEDINRISDQVNPLKIAKESMQKLIDTAQFITLFEATEKGSGVPLFKHLINRDTVNVLFGPSGSGKSFLTLDMAVHLAAGKDWASYKCKQQMAVLYICTESGSSFGKRAKAARMRAEIPDTGSLKDVPFAYYPAHVDLLNNKDHLKLVARLVDDLEQMSGIKCGLVIVDTLSAAFGGGNENSEDMTKFVNNMAALKFEKKVSVLVVHHTGKDESAGARGHSSLKGNIDTEIQIKAEKRGEKYYRSFVSTKQKDDEIGNMKRFSLKIVELGKDEDGDAITTCSVIVDGDAEFEAIAPSVEEELDVNTKCALKAIRFYHLIPDIKNSEAGHTEKQIKAILFNHFKENNKVFDEKDATNALSQLDMMAKPDKTVLKAFERCCGMLATNGLTRENAKYQLVNQDYDTCDKDTT